MIIEPPGCLGDVATIEATCTCSAKSDCANGNSAKWACTPAKRCVPLCTSNADCPSGKICDDLRCQSVICGDNSECGTNECCFGHTCSPCTPTISSCAVVPSKAVLNAGNSATFSIAAYDAHGAPLPYTGEVTWAAQGIDATTGDHGDTAQFTAASTASSASGSVTATIQGTACQPATVLSYAAPPPDQLRVVVTSQQNRQPISGATVALGAETITTDAAGIALFATTLGEKHTVSVFAYGHAYVTVIDTTATDLLLPLKATPHPGRFSGQLKDTDFNGADNKNGTMHLALMGSSIAGNLVDLSVASLLGDSQPTTINLGTGTPYGPFDLPEGIVIGLGAQTFGENGGGHFGILAAPGVRTLWSIGGNAVIGDVLKALGPVLNDNGTPIEDHIPTILTALLPIIGSLDSGVTSSLAVAPGDEKTLSFGGSAPSLKFDTAQRLRVSVTTPELPTFTDDTGAEASFDGVVVIGGALVRSQGFVPLGLTAGVDQGGPDGAMVPDHITDAIGTGGAPGKLPLRLAPRHGGIETSPWAFVTLGASIGKLVSGDSGLALSGTVSFTPSSLKYNAGAATPVDLSKPFLALPNGASITESTRTFAMPTVSGATYHQLEIGPEDRLWTIYFPAGTTSVSIPVPPNGMPDRFLGETPPVTALKSVSLGHGTTTYDQVWQFDGVNADDLTLQTDAFSVGAVPRATP